MINPYELRPGNLVNYRDNIMRVFKVHVSDDFAWINDIPFRLMDGINLAAGKVLFTPILLTPEWLGRCRLEDDKHGRLTGPQFETDNTIQWFEIEEDSKQKGLYWLRGSEWVMGRPFQFLHQLQNLYHALVGEELTIKEPA